MTFLNLSKNMENKSKTYIIIDEPKVKFLEKAIVNPVIILFAAMIVPMFTKIPYFGRWWLPFVWLVFNGIILGSPTLKKEISYSVIGLLILTAFFYGIFYIVEQQLQFDFSIIEYLFIFMYGLFFLFMYFVVFLQEAPYQIYQYIKEDKHV